LAKALYGTVRGRVETLFDDSISALEQTAEEVRVEFTRSPPRTFDVVIGADGLHSNVRRLAFGSQDRFERYLGYKVAAFEVSGYRARDPDVYVTFTQVGHQAARFSMRDDRTLFVFIFADPSDQTRYGVDEQKALVRRHFQGRGWECAPALEAMDAAPDFYFDRVSQIRMEQWARGRVALVGDAAFCVSLLAGQGSALSMVGAYVLAGELEKAGGDHARAFAGYQERLASFIGAKQRAAERFAGFFVPRSRLALILRNLMSKLLSVSVVARLAMVRELTETFRLPEYAASAAPR
jgi:2-polyprenyl-6-methoxyphenol hydroxylase-like FAD-dependent oxidoreductase